jgi:hypothetical protein
MTEINASQDAREPVGLGGWLLLPILHMFLDLAVTLTAILVVLTTPQPPTNNESHLAVALYVLACAAVALFAIFCATRLFQKKREAPGLMQALYLLLFAKVAASAILQRLFPDIQIPAMAPVSFAAGTGTAIATGIWFAYFQMSVRVRNTFVN